ncbi:hypothetical protein DX116_16305 [Aeromicrobium endophyticum]|uniref:Uncharacterized protein n=1 Tax=Aeromicrobium endophyticum TaxID=2292704 RepID=A0A371P5B5_9ACTN|nr:hypothetical protein DX116_16305 [Aeromicrobium endophyticum]
MRDELEARDFATRVVVPDTRSALSAQQVRDAGFDRVDRVPWDDLVAACLGSDVVVSALAGPSTHRLSLAVADALAGGVGPGPVLVSGWVGIIIEKITAGYLDRSGTDVVAVNSTDDLAHFRRTGETLGIPTDNLVLSGLPFLSAAPRPPRSGAVSTVLYADQPTVPAPAAERAYVYRRLVEHARRHPGREVLLKPRHRPGEDTFHRMSHAPEDLLPPGDLPANFRIDHTPVPELLERVDLLVTMSSTACLEAIDRGTRVALVLDLGVHERHGNHVFLDSGLLRTFDQIDADDLGTPSDAFLHSWFGDRDRPAPAAIADRVEQLLASGCRPSRDVWESAYFRSATRTTAEVADSAQHDEHPGNPRWMTRAWARRVDTHGTVRGTLAYGATLLLPPAVVVPARRITSRRG